MVWPSPGLLPGGHRAVHLDRLPNGAAGLAINRLTIHPSTHPPPFGNPASNICHCRCTEAHRAGTSAKGCRWRITALGVRAPRNRLWGPGNTLYTNSLCTNFLGNQITFVTARITSADAQGRRSCDVQAGYHRGSSFSQQRSLILNLACCW